MGSSWKQRSLSGMSRSSRFTACWASDHRGCDALRTQEDQAVVAAQPPQVDPHPHQGLGHRHSLRQRGAEFPLPGLAGEEAGPGEEDVGIGAEGGQFLLDAAVEAAQLVGTPSQPLLRAAVGQEAGSLSEAPGPAASANIVAGVARASGGAGTPVSPGGHASRIRARYADLRSCSKRATVTSSRPQSGPGSWA